MKRTRSIDEANLMDDDFFNIVASDSDEGEKFCRKLISVLLGKDIGDVKVIAQRVLAGTVPGIRGVRLDVEVAEYSGHYAEFPRNIYDIEQHREKETELPRMLRFRQSKIDSRHMKSGDSDFTHLPDLYVILITDFDPFGKGHMIYTIHNKCDEFPELEYNDGLKYLFFNTKGKEGGSSNIENMLGYMQNSRKESVVDEATFEIDQYVQYVREDPAFRGKYMTLGEKFDRYYKLGQDDMLALQVCKKLSRGKSLSEIAEELEMDQAQIEPVYNVAIKYAPDFVPEDVIKELHPEAN